MPKGCSIANTGEGKTIAVVARAFESVRSNPFLHVFSNFHINLPRCHFVPFMFFDFDSLPIPSMLIYDDVSNAEMLERYAKVCANRSRKAHMDLCFTGQDKIMIPPVIRRIMDYRLHPHLNHRDNTLVVIEKRKGLKSEKYQYNDVFETIGKLYDTREVVKVCLESDAVREIAKISKTERDVEENLFLYSGDKRERRRLKKEILDIMEIEPVIPEQNTLDNNNLLLKLYILNREYNISQNKLANYIDCHRSTLNLKLKEIEHDIEDLLVELK